MKVIPLKMVLCANDGAQLDEIISRLQKVARNFPGGLVEFDGLKTIITPLKAEKAKEDEIKRKKTREMTPKERVEYQKIWFSDKGKYSMEPMSTSTLRKAQ